MVSYLLYKQIKIMIWESNLLLKFLFGKCNTQETEDVNEWLNESEYNKQTLSHLRMTVSAQLA
jgi:hypothetical protein